MTTTPYQVLLYYKYVDLADPKKVMQEQRLLCETLHLKGRILIAKEGINGTVEGTKEHTEKYIQAMRETPYFKDIVFKKSTGTDDGSAFRKLVVKVRPEVVTAGMTSLNPNKISGKYITAEKLHSWFQEKKEFYVVDMRNDYEFAGGHFKNSIFSGMQHFFQLQDTLPRLAHLKNKTVVTVCTGGIRCEKASGFLVKNGFADVYQLQGGIHTYMEKYPNQDFIGKLYVFDKRMLVGFNTETPEHEVIGACMLCGKSSELYVNCAEDICHYHFIACEDCRDKETGEFFDKVTCKQTYIRNKQSL